MKKPASTKPVQTLMEEARALGANAKTATEQADDAKLLARLAKRRLKQARRDFKLARKAAKKARKNAKDLQAAASSASRKVANAKSRKRTAQRRKLSAARTRVAKSKAAKMAAQPVVAEKRATKKKEVVSAIDKTKPAEKPAKQSRTRRAKTIAPILKSPTPEAPLVVLAPQASIVSTPAGDLSPLPDELLE